jgi:VanZ family protein
MSRLLKPWLPVILWMGLIFVASSDTGNFEHSSRLIEPLLRWLCPTASAETLERLHHLVRKAAHFMEYAILALLALRALRLSQPGHSFPKALVFALVVAAAYAATDEFHQSFVPGRTAAAGDVLIDTAGAFTALVMAALGRRRANEAEVTDARGRGDGPQSPDPRHAKGR